MVMQKQEQSQLRGSLKSAGESLDVPRWLPLLLTFFTRTARPPAAFSQTVRSPETGIGDYRRQLRSSERASRGSHKHKRNLVVLTGIIYFTGVLVFPLAAPRCVHKTGKSPLAVFEEVQTYR